MDSLNFDGFLALGIVLLLAFFGFVILVIALLKNSNKSFQNKTLLLNKREFVASLLLIFPLVVLLISETFFNINGGILDTTMLILAPCIIIAVLIITAKEG